MRSLRVLGMVGVLSIVTVAPTRVHAEEPKDAGAEKQAQARAHYEQGITHYNLGEFDQAIAEFKKAYALSGAPGLLFNIAQAYRLLGDYKQAAYFYKTYLRLQPEAPNRADVEARIVEMEKALAEQKSIEEAKPKGTIPLEVKPDEKPVEVKPDEKPVEVKPDEPVVDVKPDRPKDEPVGGKPGRNKKLLGLSIGGAGVALVATAVAFSLKASGAAADITRISDMGGMWSPDLDSKYAEGQSAQTTATVLYIAGSAAIIGGATFYYLGLKADKASGDVAVVPGHGGGMVVWSGEF